MPRKKKVENVNDSSDTATDESAGSTAGSTDGSVDGSLDGSDSGSPANGGTDSGDSAIELADVFSRSISERFANQNESDGSGEPETSASSVDSGRGNTSRASGRRRARRNRSDSDSGSERAAENESAKENAPRKVNFEKLLGADKKLDARLQKIFVGTAIEMPFKGAARFYGLPFWELQQNEIDDLTEKTLLCIATLPKSTAKIVLGLLGKYAPWFGLASALAIVTYPRYAATKEIYARQQEINSINQNTSIPDKQSEANPVTNTQGQRTTLDNRIAFLEHTGKFG